VSAFVFVGNICVANVGQKAMWGSIFTKNETGRQNWASKKRPLEISPMAAFYLKMR
jgi:hypothetical protein